MLGADITNKVCKERRTSISDLLDILDHGTASKKLLSMNKVM
jgi:hypothetical protein